MDDAIFFRQATTRICGGTLDPTAVLERCFDFLEKFMPMESISMSMYDMETRAFRNIAYFIHPKYEHLVPPAFWDTPFSVPVSSFQHLLSLGGHSPSFIINDVSADTGGRQICDALGIHNLSYLILNVNIGQDIPGHIFISTRGLDQYTKEHARLMKLIRDPFSIAMSNAIQHQEVVRLKDLLSEDNRYLFDKLHQKSNESIIGRDHGLKEIMNAIMQVSKLNNIVLLLGETGVGKELIANAIHYNSQQASGSFVKINCGAIPDNLIDSELFGYEKGAFTGAYSSKRGHFERAHNGTLFLDEIGDLPLSAQVRLLRVIQQKELMRVGGIQPIKINVRIITATHHDLESMVQNGEFRKDLWFRINIFPITIPPLRERMEDLPALVEYFINRKSQEMNLRQRPRLSSKAIQNLMSYDWPGNVRELENCVERELIQNVIGHKKDILEFEKIGNSLKVGDNKLTKINSDLLTSFDEATRQHFYTVLKFTKGKIQGINGAAAILKMEPNTLRHHLKKLGIPFGRQRYL